MKKKTINSIITKKFAEYLQSIKNEQVRALVAQNSLISGGCIASMLLDEKINDFDIYFTNKETVLAVAGYYCNLYNKENPSRGMVVVDVDNLKQDDPSTQYYHDRGIKEPGRVSCFAVYQSYENESEDAEAEREILDKVLATKKETKEEKKPYHLKFVSPNAISLADDIQLIIRFYGDSEEIHSNYDYVHCTNYWLSKDKTLHLNQRALEAILAKELIYIGSKYPLASILRLRKFIKRNWSINAGQVLKILFQISKLNLEDPSILEDQLVGVDIAYFMTVIEYLKEERERCVQSGEIFRFNYEYICEIVDRVFGDK